MKTFADLPLGPETVAALAAEGMETPTPFQAAAIPVIARGHDLLGRAGPGSGTMVGYGAPLIDRLQGGAGSPVCAVLCTGHVQATELARSFARLAAGSDLRAAALAPHWNLPERADFLFVPAARLAALYDGTVAAAGLRAIVVHDGDGVVRVARRDHLEAFLSGLPQECQRIMCGLPFGPELHSLARGFTRRAATVAGAGLDAKGPPRDLNVVVFDGDRAEAVLALAADLLADADAVRHVLLHAASADHAADLGDLLDAHGYRAGPPGDQTAPVWLCPEGDESARAVVDAMDGADRVATVSCAVPPGAKAAAVRHGGAFGPAWAVAAVREMGHLRQIAAGAGMKLNRVRPERLPRVAAAIDELADRVHDVVRAPELAPYLLLVESLGERFAAAEVAAAALLLLDRERAAKGRAARAGATRTGTGGAMAPEAPAGAPVKWVKLYASSGRQDEIGPGNLLGAIVGESGVPGNRVGRIDVRDRHSLIEVHELDAPAVIRALNGTTMGGRALRVDYDRSDTKRDDQPGPGRGDRSGPTRRGPSGGKPREGRPHGDRPPRGGPPKGKPRGGWPPKGGPPRGRPTGGRPPRGGSPRGKPPSGKPPRGGPPRGGPPSGKPHRGGTRGGRRPPPGRRGVD